MSETYRIKRRGSLVLANETVYDHNISYTALGVLCVMLARPDDAPKGYRTLMRPGVGQRAILAAFRELREQGYRYQFYRTDIGAKGRARVYTCTYIYEVPVSLEMAKRDHYEATGQVAREVGSASKSKDTLASVCDAHSRDAHSRDAHSRAAHTVAAQSSGSALEAFSPSNEEINQSAGDAEPAEPAPEAGDESPPPLPQGSHRDDATPRNAYGITPQQAAINSKGAALARAALRGERLAAS